MTRDIKFRIRFENGAVKTCLVLALNILEKQNPIAKLIEAGNKIISIEEFTGVKDKNGKEICEGDIVVMWWYSLYDPKKRVNEGQGVVEMRKGCFGYETIKNKFWFLVHDRLEVVGNIYENPELLREIK
jgi:uncharacterized phage protein (TIGR01671 family)